MQIDQQYGKSNVRVSHVERRQRDHVFRELELSIRLEGDFAAAYAEGDNALVVPTDTIKNTVYAMAHDHGIVSMEHFVAVLANHFLAEYGHVARVHVEANEQPWERLIIGDESHPHSFSAASFQHTCRLSARRGQDCRLSCGLTNLRLLKTTGSGFSGFHQDALTTLAATNDRIMATNLSAEWPCPHEELDWSAVRQRTRSAIEQVFAETFSPSVQRTMYKMAGMVFDECPEIDEIRLQMPNQHHILADLTSLGRDNENRIFVPTREPYGDIAATFRRDRD